MKKALIICLAILVCFGFVACKEEPHQHSASEDSVIYCADGKLYNVCGTCNEKMDTESILEPYTIKTIKIADDVTSIGDAAFDNCKAITSISIPNSVTSIGSSVFASCESLTSITIPDSVTSMGPYNFESCYNLESVTLSNNLKSLEAANFFKCSKLVSITIPVSVTSINKSAFNSSGIKTVNYPGTKAQWDLIGLDLTNLPGAKLEKIICSDDEITV